MRRYGVVAIAGFVALFACGDRYASGGTDDTGTESSSGTLGATDSSSADGGSGTSGATTASEETTATGATGTGTGGLDCADPALSTLGDPCDTWRDDQCGPCFKCMLWRYSPGMWWEGAKCSPLDPDPKPLGDACALVELPDYVLADDCGRRAMCFELGATPRCRGFCHGSGSNTTCEDLEAYCVATTNGIADMCHPPCYPLTPDCEEGLGCLPTTTGFFTCQVVDPDPRDVGESCGFHYECMSPLVCASGSCTELCDLDGPDTCLAGLSCQVYYENGDIAPI